MKDTLPGDDGPPIRGGRYIMDSGKPTQDPRSLLAILQKMQAEGYLYTLNFTVTTKDLEVSFKCGLSHLDTISQGLESARTHLKENSKDLDSHGNLYDVILPSISNPLTLLD